MLKNGYYFVSINSSDNKSNLIDDDTYDEFKAKNFFSQYSEVKSGPRQVSKYHDGNVFCISEGYYFDDPSSSLSEHIVDMYYKSEPNFLKTLEIEASFVIYEVSKQRVIAFRDPSCVFNIFYTQNNGTLKFSNDISSLIPSVNKKLSTVGASFFIKEGWSYGPFTLFDNIYTILPYSAIDVNLSDIKQNVNLSTKINYYWRPQYRNDYVLKSDEELTSHFSELFKQNIDNHSLNNNAVFFSGGLDSTIVASSLLFSKKQTYAYRWNIKDLAPYELPLIKKYYSHTNIPNEFIKIDTKSPDYYEKYKLGVLNNPVSPVYSDSITQLVARQIKNDLGEDTMIFNGELALFDAGFSDVNNKSRNIRRKLYLNPFYLKIIKYTPKIIGRLFALVSTGLDKIALDYINGFGIPKPISYILGILSSLGDINRYYSGLLIGKRKFPGWSTYNPRWLNSKGAHYFHSRVTDGFVKSAFNEMDINHPSLALNYFKYLMYNISSNQSVYPIAAQMHGLNHCLPFNTKEIIELSGNIPVRLWKDKTIERLSAKNYFGAPELVADYPKNMKEPVPTYKTLWSDEFFEKAREVLSNPTFIDYLDDELFNKKYLRSYVAKTISDIKYFNPDILNIQLVINHYYENE
jgi:hypothetical protein